MFSPTFYNQLSTFPLLAHYHKHRQQANAFTRLCIGLSNWLNLATCPSLALWPISSLFVSPILLSCPYHTTAWAQLFSMWSTSPSISSFIILQSHFLHTLHLLQLIFCITRAPYYSLQFLFPVLHQRPAHHHFIFPCMSYDSLHMVLGVWQYHLFSSYWLYLNHIHTVIQSCLQNCYFYMLCLS